MNKDNSKHVDIVKRLAKGIDEGTTHRFTCPACRGEYSLAVTRKDNEVLYHCFRASCTLSGGVVPATSKKAIVRASSGHTEHVPTTEYDLPESVVYNPDTPRWVSMYQHYPWLYGCSDVVNLGMYDTAQDRCVFISKDRYITVGRGDGIPKWYRYDKNSSVPFVARCIGDVHTCVVVEDTLSAIRIGGMQGYVGIALLGTDMRTNMAYHIKDKVLAENVPIVVALDRDATIKGRGITKLLHLVMPTNDTHLTMLDEYDIKDMNDREFTIWMQRLQKSLLYYAG